MSIVLTMCCLNKVKGILQKKMIDLINLLKLCYGENYEAYVQDFLLSLLNNEKGLLNNSLLDDSLFISIMNNIRAKVYL